MTACQNLSRLLFHNRSWLSPPWELTWIEPLLPMFFTLHPLRPMFFCFVHPLGGSVISVFCLGLGCFDVETRWYVRSKLLWGPTNREPLWASYRQSTYDIHKEKKIMYIVYIQHIEYTLYIISRPRKNGLMTIDATCYTYHCNNMMEDFTGIGRDNLG